MRALVNFLLRVYFLPFTGSVRAKRYIRDTILIDKLQHLRQAVRFIKSNSVNPKDIIIDIGAANGEILMFLQTDFPTNPFYAFEPNPAFQDILHLKSKKSMNIKIRNIALSNKPGEMPFFVNSNSLTSSLKKADSSLLKHKKHPYESSMILEKELLVQVNTLDNEFADNSENVLLIKLDVQGAELDVLSGGTQLLQRTKYILTEMQKHKFYENSSSYDVVDRFLQNQGFELVDIIANYRREGLWLEEYDAIYRNKKFFSETV